MTTEDEMSAVFHALAHDSRRRIMDLIKARPGMNVGQLANEFDVSRMPPDNGATTLYARAG